MFVAAVRASGTCCSRASYFKQCAGKHGPHWRAHIRTARRTHPEQTANFYKYKCLKRRSSRQHGNPPKYNCACIGIHGSQVRLGQKMFYLYSSFTSGEPSRRIPNISARPTACCSEEARWREATPSMAFIIWCFSFFLRRVIVVARSHPVLATGPCWHSFSQRHVTTSLHNSEARVLFRASDWPTAAEARPKRSALIGFRSINSDCHVLMEGSLYHHYTAYNVVYWR